MTNQLYSQWPGGMNVGPTVGMRRYDSHNCCSIWYRADGGSWALTSVDSMLWVESKAGPGSRLSNPT